MSTKSSAKMLVEPEPKSEAPSPVSLAQPEESLPFPQGSGLAWGQSQLVVHGLGPPWDRVRLQADCLP